MYRNDRIGSSGFERNGGRDDRKGWIGCRGGFIRRFDSLVADFMDYEPAESAGLEHSEASDAENRSMPFERQPHRPITGMSDSAVNALRAERLRWGCS